MALDPRASNRILLPGDLREQSQRIQMNQAKIDDIPQQRQSAQVDMRIKELNEKKAQIDALGQLVGSAVDEPSYQAALQKAKGMGLDVSQEPPVFDPNYVRQAGMSLLNARDRVELELKQAESALKQQLTGAQIGTEQAQAGAYGALANQRNAAAGLNAANTERVRATPINMPTSSGAGGGSGMPKAPVGYRWNEGGNLEYIPGGPKDPATQQAKPLTEGQSNAALYASRMNESNKIIGDLETRGYKPSLATDALADSAVGNAVLTPQGQQFTQAKRDFINAVLRRESGAVISPEEFKNANKQYFPQPGDTKEVLKQKASNRTTAIKGIENAAGPALKKADYSKMSDNEIRKSLGL